MSLTNSRADQKYRRQQRVRSTRSWLHSASGLGGVALVLLVLRGPWLGIPVVLAVILVLQLIRYLIGRSLPKPPGPMMVTDLKDPDPAPHGTGHHPAPHGADRQPSPLPPGHPGSPGDTGGQGDRENQQGS